MQEEWSRKGATLSDKTAQKEFGLTRTRSSRRSTPVSLSTRSAFFHGNPWLMLLRREVEDLVDNGYKDRDHQQRRARAELARVDRILKKFRAEAALEEHRAKHPADPLPPPLGLRWSEHVFG